PARPHLHARRRRGHRDDHGAEDRLRTPRLPAVRRGAMSPRETRLIEPGDFAEAMHVRSFAFGHPLNDGHRAFLERNAGHILGSFEDGRLQSVATMWPFTAYVG